VLPAGTVAEDEEPDAAPTVKSSPVPESATVCGLFEALSVMLNVPVRFPPAVGVKITLIAQFAFSATELPQVFVSAKSPLATMLETPSAALPLLNKITVSAALGTPIVWPENVRLDGDRSTTGPVPVPAKFTF